jgi:hypothetical protein
MRSELTLLSGVPNHAVSPRVCPVVGVSAADGSAASPNEAVVSAASPARVGEGEIARGRSGDPWERLLGKDGDSRSSLPGEAGGTPAATGASPLPVFAAPSEPAAAFCPISSAPLFSADTPSVDGAGTGTKLAPDMAYPSVSAVSRRIVSAPPHRRCTPRHRRSGLVLAQWLHTDVDPGQRAKPRLSCVPYHWHRAPLALVRKRA